jgi:hypothetical protein
MAIRRTLGGLCAVTGAWTVLLLLTGGFFYQIGPLRLSSQAPRTPFVIALVSGLTAWAMQLTANRSARALPESRVRRVGLLSSLILGLGVMFLFQAAPPTNVNNCLFIHEMGSHMRHVLNCDAVEYLALARTPSMVLTKEHPYRQSRPLSFVAPHIVALPFRLTTWLNDRGIYPPYGPEFAAFALINLVVLVVTMRCFVRTLEMAQTGVPPGIEVLLALVVLGANDVTKLYFWSSHAQIYNLFVPCLTVYAILRLLSSGRALGWREALCVGLALGVGLLMYGSFSVTLVCVCAIQLFVYRRIVPTFIVGAAAVVVYAAWVVYVRLTAGFFYSYETEMYRQFVWLIDCYQAGRAVCVPRLVDNTWAFIDRLAQMTMVPLALIALVRVARFFWPGSREGSGAPAVNRSVGPAVAGCVLVSGTLLLLMGDAQYMPRLYWILIPPMLLVLSIDLQQLRVAMPPRAQRALSGVVFAGTLAYLLILTLREGPYQ